MATTADFRNGLVIEFNHDLFSIVEFQHVKPGKGPAFVRTKLKSLTTGKVIDNTFTSGHKVTTARVERRDYQFLFKDDMGYHFMDSNTFEQIPVQENLINAPQFLKDGQEVEILFHAEEEKVLGVELPQHVVLKVVYTEPGLKGDTATNATKPAEMETGATVQVPLFIDQDEVIKINTLTNSYVERVK
ncbi:elongation factor P [Marinoscillum furvescens]|uniref:Elongation factor P n=1 Tax=Marinoscillum furvescens DSM 4134 TaxID=1122208 RepID=A0A3D9L4R6_MARFU|nr:elongation factor P [Marinoscillum furvescens]REE01015.1 translation elongation factor P (EF-P) [Marinoscillum furvescens DSM 4134]